MSENNLKADLADSQIILSLTFVGLMIFIAFVGVTGYWLSGLLYAL